MKKKSPTSKSHAESAKPKRASGSIYMLTEQVFLIVLKSIISSIVPYCPKEILVEISKFINMIYPKLKDPGLNSVMENDTVKRRELVWKNVTIRVQDVLFPLMQAVNTVQELLLEVPDKKDDIIMADSTKIKEINATSSSLSENPSSSARLEQAIKAYASTQKKIAKYIGPSL
jgi:hypothetical protein